MDETLTLVEKTLFLKSIPILASMPTESLAQLAARAREIHFEAGQVIFQEGEVNKGIFLIVEGMVELRKERALLAAVTEGKAFGELGLGVQEAHHLTAVAGAHTHVINVTTEDVTETVLDYPEVGLALVQMQGKRIAELLNRILMLEEEVARLDTASKEKSG